MMTIREVNTYSDLLALSPVWNKLLSESELNCIFLTFEWIRNWIDVFGLDRRLRIILGYDGTTLVGIAPLMVSRRYVSGIMLNSLELIGSGDEVTPDGLGFIVSPLRQHEFIREAVKYLKQVNSWDMIKLRDLRDDASFLGITEDFSREGFQCTVRDNGVCPYIELPRKWEDYLKSLSSHNRYNIGRKERTLNRHFTVDFSLCTSPDELGHYFRRLETLHRRRMEEKRMDGASLQEPFWKFHELVARDLLEKGWLFFGALTAGSHVAACHYAFNYNGKVSFYQSGIDPDYGKYSVGLLSTAYMIRESIRCGAIEYDFLRGSEEYKYRWANTFRRNREIVIWNRNPKVIMPMVYYYSRQFLGNLRNRLKPLMEQ